MPTSAVEDRDATSPEGVVKNVSDKRGMLAPGGCREPHGWPGKNHPVDPGHVSPVRETPGIGEPAANEQLPQIGPSKGDFQMDRAELWWAVAAAIDLLETRAQHMFVAHYFLNQPLPEIASRMGCSLYMVEQTLSKAKWAVQSMVGTSRT